VRLRDQRVVDDGGNVRPDDSAFRGRALCLTETFLGAVDTERFVYLLRRRLCRLFPDLGPIEACWRFVKHYLWCRLTFSLCSDVSPDFI